MELLNEQEKQSVELYLSSIDTIRDVYDQIEMEIDHIQGPVDWFNGCSQEYSDCDWKTILIESAEDQGVYSEGVYQAYVDNCGEVDSVQELIGLVEESYQGEHRDGADFAQSIAEETGAIDEDLTSWIVIDWEATWDCNLRLDYWESNGYFFRNV